MKRKTIEEEKDNSGKVSRKDFLKIGTNGEINK
jgi:hypothetical protein